MCQTPCVVFLAVVPSTGAYGSPLKKWLVVFVLQTHFYDPKTQVPGAPPASGTQKKWTDKFARRFLRGTPQPHKNQKKMARAAPGKNGTASKAPQKALPSPQKKASKSMKWTPKGLCGPWLSGQKHRFKPRLTPVRSRQRVTACRGRREVDVENESQNRLSGSWEWPSTPPQRCGDQVRPKAARWGSNPTSRGASSP